MSRSYAATLLVELPAADEEHLAALSSNTRRHVRAISGHPVTLLPIEDEHLAPRMDALVAATKARTAGVHQTEDWRWRIALSTAAPHLSRLVGLFQTGVPGPESLVAFAWGCCHGEHAHYDAAASTRQTSVRMSLAYAPMWDLMCWARHQGARWWDLGGITAGHRGGDDPLGGISDFKRHFGDTVRSVGEAWAVEVKPLRSGLARAAQAVGNVLRPPKR
jgi:hypothetical protein